MISTAYKMSVRMISTFDTIPKRGKEMYRDSVLSSRTNHNAFVCFSHVKARRS